MEETIEVVETQVEAGSENTPEPTAVVTEKVVTEEVVQEEVKAEGFFDDEQVSENELKGIEEETETKTETQTDDKSGQETADARPKEDVKVDDGQPAKVETDPAEAADVKPPKGFVPQQALSEERGKRKELKQQLADVEAELADWKARTPETEEGADEFKVLSDAEYDELIDDHPQEALRYQRKLARHQASEKNAERRAATEDSQMESAFSAIEELAPGIYDDGSTVAVELGNFAVEQGFDPEFLNLITDPGSRISARDSKGSILLAEGAASVVRMISALKTRGAGVESEREAIRASLYEEVTKEVMGKLKAGGAATPPSINDLPGEGEIPGVGKILSEAQLAELPKSERAAYLGG